MGDTRQRACFVVIFSGDIGFGRLRRSLDLECSFFNAFCEVFLHVFSRVFATSASRGEKSALPAKNPKTGPRDRRKHGTVPTHQCSRKKKGCIANGTLQR